MDPATIEAVTKIVEQHSESGHTGLAATIASLVGVMLIREINYWMSKRKESRYANGGSGLIDVRNRVADVDRHIKDLSVTTREVGDTLESIANTTENFQSSVEKFHDKFDDQQEKTRLTLQSVRETVDRIERHHTTRRRGE